MYFPSTVIHRTDYSMREPCPNLNRFKLAELVSLARDEDVYRSPRYCAPVTTMLSHVSQFRRDLEPGDRWTVNLRDEIPHEWVHGFCIARPGGEVDCSYTITVQTAVGNEVSWDFQTAQRDVSVSMSFCPYISHPVELNERVSYVFVSLNAAPPDLSGEVDGLGISAISILMNDMAIPEARHVILTVASAEQHPSALAGP
jgi:hypothetical protein